MIPSPKNRPAPKMPSVVSTSPSATLLRWSSAVERHDPAVAAVVGAHDEARVLDRDEHHQRPEDQRCGAVDVRGGDVRRRAVGAEDRLLGVERARADVAVHDAQRAEREHGRARVRDHIPVLVLELAEAFAELLGLVGAVLDAGRHVVDLVRGHVETALARRPLARADVLIRLGARVEVDLVRTLEAALVSMARCRSSPATYLMHATILSSPGACDERVASGGVAARTSGRRGRRGRRQ